MSESLKGNLAQLKLTDVMKILSSRTGKLSLQCNDETADIYFLQGAIIHAKCASVSGEEAVYTILSWNEGTFTFHPNISVKNGTITTPSEEILRRATIVETEWEGVRQTIPNTNLVFKMSSGTPREISLNATEWNILRHVNGIDSVREISKKMELGLLDVAKALCKLVAAGIIDMVGESVTREERRRMGVDPMLFDMIEKEMARYIGPLAPIVLDDHISEMGERRDAFPKDKLPELAELLSGEITDPRKVIEFQKNMLDIIKNV